ncbi:zinc finger protein Rlf isoform X1 [Scyliorhinus canicula]|uniref:zinc finger protein Rlf isoform X1 n=1 Tax=Scyliorhinus canicula TaxID=7830 RepID=UPI0018F361DB|nr:zinc finger protein Rlf isoform X1 [Scyliorhinus canicula]
MADGESEQAPEPLTERLRRVQAELRRRGLSKESSAHYCQRFCEILVQYGEKCKTSEELLPLLEIYRISIQSYTSARPYLTTECAHINFVLNRLAVSCFEILLSLSEKEVPQEVWQQLQQTLQDSHNALLEFGHNELQALVAITREGGAWENPVLQCILSKQPTETPEVNNYLIQEGPAFLEIRIKHLMKTDHKSDATLLAKCCAENSEINSKGAFRQIYLTCLCTMGPNEEAAKEIAHVDCKEVLDIICNLESDGQDNAAFVLCTTFLTHQLQQESVYCSWELTLFWSKLQRRMDPSLDSFLERCRQLGIIARTVYHIFFLIKVIQSEAEGAGLPVSIELCVGALRIQSNENAETKISICKTIACLMPDDLEVRRACQLTQFLLEPTVDAYREVEKLYKQPDQKYDEENGPIPNSLHCELLLVLKSHWPFDPEFWDWKTLKRHCRGHLGEHAAAISEDELSEDELDGNELFDQMSKIPETMNDGREKDGESFCKKKEKVMSERYYRWLQNMFFCVLCKKDYVVARIVHHAKTHIRDGIFSCPVCAKKFKKKEQFTPHVKEHIKKPKREKKLKKKAEADVKSLLPALNVSPPPKQQLPVDEVKVLIKKEVEENDYIIFSGTDLVEEGQGDVSKPEVDETAVSQWTESYPCPGTDCLRSFKYYKNLTAHLKNDHLDNDENVKHFLEMNNRKALCKYCRRHFVSDYHLKAHLKVHSGLEPYICIQMDCNASFQAFADLVKHRKQHKEFRSKCMFKGCNKVFSGSCLLYHHEAQHYREAAYSCNLSGCKKFYFSKSEFQNHLQTHGITSLEDFKAKFLKKESDTTEDLVNYDPKLMTAEEKLQPNSSTENADEKLNEIAGRSSGSCSYSLPQDVVKKEKEAQYSPGGSYYPEVQGTDGADSVFVNKSGSGNSNLQSVYSENLLVPLEKLASFKELSDIEDMMKAATLHPELNRSLTKHKITTGARGSLTALNKLACGIEDCIMMYALTKDLKKHIKIAHPNYYKAKKRIGKHSRGVMKGSAPNQVKGKTELVQQVPPRSSLQGEEGESGSPAIDKLCRNKNVLLKARAKKPKNNRNAKWPAIFKDNKFVCSRCFKEFSNPKSLGGHLARKIKCPLLAENSAEITPVKSYVKQPPNVASCTPIVPTLEELERALQKLQLDKSETLRNEVMVCTSTLSPPPSAELPPTSIPTSDASVSTSSGNDSQLQPHSHELFQNDSSKEDSGIIKPFVCDHEGCAFKAMTKDGLINHYVKTHKYSKDKVLQLSRFQLRFAPFKCHICLRTFTRKTNLRTHYKQMHRFSKEDMLKGKFSYINCVSVPSNTNPQLNVPNILIKTENDSPHLTEENLSSAQDVAERLSLSENAEPIKTEEDCLYPMSVSYQTTNFNLFGDDEHAQFGPVSGNWRQTGSDSENTMNESITTERECSESTESLKSEEMRLNGSMESSMMPDSADDSESKEEGRGSRRIGAKSNLCYILNKYHKPYHCIHKGCSAAFTGQPNLIRHYQTVHQYNREQMCLEEDQGNAKKDNTKVKKIFKCKFEGCTKRFQYPRVLLRHYSEIHKLAGSETGKYACNQPDCLASFNVYSSLRRHLQQAHEINLEVRRETPGDLQFKCSIDGCSRTYTIRSSYLRHVQRQHKAHYKSILLRPRKNFQYDYNPDLERCVHNHLIDGAAHSSASMVEPDKLFRQEHLTDEDSCGSALLGESNLGQIHAERLTDEGSSDSESEDEPDYETYQKHLDSYGSALKHESNFESRNSGGLDGKTYRKESELESDLEKSITEHHSDDTSDSATQEEHSERNESCLTLDGSLVDDSEKDSRKSVRCCDFLLKSRDHGFSMCKAEVLRDQFPCMVDDCQTVVLSRRSILRHYKIQHKIAPKYIEQNLNTLLVCKKYSDPSRSGKLGSDSRKVPKNLVSEQTEETPGCSVLRQQNGETPLKTEFKIEPEQIGTGQQLHNCSVGNDAVCNSGNVLFPGKTVSSNSANKGPSFKENDANQAFLPKNGGVITNLAKQSANQNGSLFAKLKHPLKRKSEMEGQSQRTNSTLTQGSLFGTRDGQQKPFDLTTYKPIGFEASFLKFIQESEDTENDVDETWHWEPPKRCKKYTSQKRESAVNTGLKESTMENCDEYSADCDKNDSVHNSFPAIEPLISPGPSPSLENLRTILDKALTDCGDLALKQLHFLRPVVVLERSEFSTPLIELFPTKKSDELCVGSS